MLDKLDKELSLFAHRIKRVGLGKVLVELDDVVAEGWNYGDIEHEDNNS